MTVIIDTREQTPWGLAPFGCTVKVRKLNAGDYALEGDEDNFTIERKSLQDFLGTVSTGWDRLQRELGRTLGFTQSMPIVVEGDFAEFCYRMERGQLLAPEHPHHRLGPAFCARRVAQLTRMGCQVVFAGNADNAALIGYAMLHDRSQVIKCS